MIKKRMDTIIVLPLYAILLFIGVVHSPSGWANSMSITYDPQNNTMYILAEKVVVADTDAEQTYKYTLYNFDYTQPFSVQPKLLHEFKYSAARKFVSMVWDPFNQRLLFADQRQREIITLNPKNALLQTLSANLKNVGPDFLQLGAMTIDLIAKRLLIIDQMNVASQPQRMVTAVSLENGDRKIIASTAIGAGPTAHVNDIQFDNLYNRVYLISNINILGIDLYTGNRFTLSDTNSYREKNHFPLHSSEITLAKNATDLMVTDPVSRRILSVDTTTGIHRIVASDVVGLGDPFCWVQSPISLGDHLVVVDNGMGALAAIHKMSGNRSSVKPFTTHAVCNNGGVTEPKNVLHPNTFLIKALSLKKPPPALRLPVFNKFGNNNVTTVLPIHDSNYRRLSNALWSLGFLLAAIVLVPPMAILGGLMLIFQATTLKSALSAIGDFVALLFFSIPTIYIFGFLYLMYSSITVMIVLSDVFLK